MLGNGRSDAGSLVESMSSENVRRRVGIEVVEPGSFDVEGRTDL